MNSPKQHVEKSFDAPPEPQNFCPRLPICTMFKKICLFIGNALSNMVYLAEFFHKFLFFNNLLASFFEMIMNKQCKYFLLLPITLVLGACATTPTGPNILVLPAQGSTFERFKKDDFECRSFAQYQIGGNMDQAATDAGVNSAATGALVGALAGAAVGGRGSTGTGAGIGLLFGSIAGAGAANQASQYNQRQYDHAYLQCMHAKGHQLPDFAHRRAAAPPSVYSAPYPPPPPQSLNAR